MTSAEARGYAVQYLAARWDPVADELAALEAAAAVPDPTATPEPTPEPTPVPNQAPVVNTQAKRYAAFTGTATRPGASWSGSASRASSPTPTATN